MPEPHYKPKEPEPGALKWSAFLLTSCLSTSAIQGVDFNNEITGVDRDSGPLGGVKKEAAHDAQLSINAIIDEYFSADALRAVRKAIIPDAWAQGSEAPPTSPDSVADAGGGVTPKSGPDGGPDSAFDSKAGNPASPGPESGVHDAPPPPPPPPPHQSPAPVSDCMYLIANEGETFALNGCHYVVYGVGDTFDPPGWTPNTKLCNGPIGCNNDTFGKDPHPGKLKACYTNYCSSLAPSYDSSADSSGDGGPDSPPPGSPSPPPPPPSGNESPGGTGGEGEGGFGGGINDGGGGGGGNNGQPGPKGADSQADSLPDSMPDSLPDSGMDSNADAPPPPGCVVVDNRVFTPFADALPVDTRYRDMCISGASLSTKHFDIHTGQQSIGIKNVSINGTNPTADMAWNDFATPDAAAYFAPPPDNPPLACYAGTFNPTLPPQKPPCNTVDGAPPCVFGPPPANAYCDPYPQLPGSCPTTRFPNVNDTMYGPGLVDGTKPTGAICMPVRDTGNYNTRIKNISAGYTPNINDIRRAFSYYMQADDLSTFDPARVKARAANSYGDYNFYKPESFFGSQSAVAGCPAELMDYADTYGGLSPDSNRYNPPTNDRDSTVKRILFRQFQAAWCYKYIILSHSDTPWRATELHNGTNGDPLSLFDADRSYLNTCQPLVRGDLARLLEYDSAYSQSGNDKLSGFAPVHRYKNDPTHDEDEYTLGSLLQQEWDYNFNPNAYSANNTDTKPSGNPRYKLKQMLPKTFPPIELPCIKEIHPDPLADSWTFTNPCTFPDAASSCPYPGPGYSPFSMPPDYEYESMARNTPYCPNVEKIIVPSKFTPFVPRDRFPQPGAQPWLGVYSGTQNSPFFQAMTALNYNNGYFKDPNYTYKDANGISHPLIRGLHTDRDYSDYTSIPILSPIQNDMCAPDRTLLYWGYTAWNGIGRATTDGVVAANNLQTIGDIQQPWRYNNAYPVQCAIVPVDILTFRSAAFDSCITQRISYNFQAFIAQWMTSGPLDSNDKPSGAYPFPAEWNTLEGHNDTFWWNDTQNPKSPMYGVSASQFKPPCATRFYEYDDMSVCPVKLSIQQCCHIIIKDLVPANFVKIRLQEGLKAARLKVKLPNPNDPNNPKYIGNRPNYIGVTNLPHSNQPYTYYLIDDWFNYDKKTDSWFAYGEKDDPFGDTYGSGQGRFARNAWGWTAMRNAQCYTRLLTMYDADGKYDKNKGKYYDPGKAHEPQDYLFGSYLTELYKDEIPDPAQNSPYAKDVCIGADKLNFGNKILGYHMPYMRWWDTGVSAENPRAGGSFLNTLGGFTTLVGVGREEITDSDVLDSKLDQKYVVSNHSHETCQDPGVWLDPLTNPPFANSFGGMLNIDATKTGANAFPNILLNKRPSEMGRAGGLNELYASQAMSIRYDAMFCLSRFERTLKSHGAEDSVLARAGGGFASRGNPQQSQGLGKVMSHEWPWPLGWRGYVTDTTTSRVATGTTNVTKLGAFPNWPPNGAAAASNNGMYPNTSLDNAQKGDIIIIAPPGSKNGSVQGDDPPKVMFVTSVHTQLSGDKDPYYIEVVFWDQSKFPTSAYSTFGLGQGSTKKIFRDYIPSPNKNPICKLTYSLLTPNPDYTKISSEPDYTEKSNCWNPRYKAPLTADATTQAEANYQYCQKYCQPDILSDTDYRMGVLPYELWQNVTIYRPTEDVRKCTDATSNTLYPTISTVLAGTQIQFTLDDQPEDKHHFDIVTTYKRTLADTSGALKAELGTILFQNRSNLVDSNLFSFCANAGFDPFPLWKNATWSYTGYGTGASTLHYFCGAKIHHSNDPYDPNNGKVVGWTSCSNPGQPGFVPIELQRTLQGP